MRDGAGVCALGLVRLGLTSVLAASWLEALVRAGRCSEALARRSESSRDDAHGTAPSVGMAVIVTIVL